MSALIGYADGMRFVSRHWGLADLKARLAGTLSEEQRTAPQRAAESCLVHNTSRRPPVVNIVVDGGDHS